MEVKFPKKLHDYFYEATKHGEIINENDLLKFCKKNKIMHDRHLLKYLKYYYDTASIFSNPKHEKSFSDNLFPRYGYYHIDIANYQPQRARYNKNNIGFIIIVSTVSFRIFAYPVKNKSSSEWMRVVNTFIEERTDVRNFYSDKDAAVGQNFLDKLQENHEISWNKADLRSKAFYAEVGNKVLKHALTVATESNKTKNWVAVLPKVLEFLDNRLVLGTSFKRKDINKENFKAVLSEILNVEDPSVYYNVSSTNFFLPKFENNFIFQEGDIVRISSRHLKDKNAFSKKTVEGYWSRKKYRIIRKKYNITEKKQYIDVYKLEDLDTNNPVRGLFYSHDLIPVFAEQK